MQVTHNNNNTTTVTTQHGTATLPTALWALFAACTAPTPLVGLVAQAQAAGFSNGYVRAQVQNLAQPGQYKGSACIGAINTSTQGKRLLVQVAQGGPAPARPKLTRSGSNTPAAQALAAN
jgi:hypothetical protein